MKKLDLIQGTQEWLEARLNHFTASEAPAMLGESKHMTRSQLLDLKKGWLSNPVSDFTQKLFDDGHEHEDMAREITELEILEDFPPVVGSRVVNGMELLASFDGFGDAGAWEHKDWNKTLAENVRNSILEPHYYWQLEHQCLVGNLAEILFTCSDGTESNRVSMIYQSIPERRDQLIAGWQQFAQDLEKHELTAKTEKVVAHKSESLPVISYQMNGLSITSNLDVFKQAAENMVEDAKLPIESDQDFANAEMRVKEFKKAEDKIKSVSAAVLGEIESVDKFTKDLAYIGEQIRQARLATDKQVKSRKEEIKREIEQKASSEFVTLVNSINAELRVNIEADTSPIANAMKGKKTVDSLKDSALTALSSMKINVNEQAAIVRANAELMRKPEYNEFKFLFIDWSQIAFKANDDFEALVKTRITEHKEAEAKRLEDERKRMEAEAKARAEEKAKREVKGKSLIDTWRSLLDVALGSDDPVVTGRLSNEIARSNCDEEIFVDNFDEALAIYDECYTKINDRHSEVVKLKAEEAKREATKAELKPAQEAGQQSTDQPSRLEQARQLVQEVEASPVASVEKAERPDEMVSLTVKEYNELMRKSDLLDALYAAGVDNWDGYGEAMDMISAA